MPATTTCPSSDRLVAFQSGSLALAELEHIAEHVEHCAACTKTLADVSTKNDALVDELRRTPTTDAFADESGCHQAVARVEAFLESATITRDQTSGAADTVDHVPPSGGKNTAAAGVGVTLGKYRLLAEIGKGGMGKVYKATHTLLKRTVALKVLPPERLKDAHALARFRREIEAAGRLDHPNIVRTHDADEADGQHFLVMEWLEGRDLAQHVKAHGPLSVNQACDFIRQASLGLDYAHRHHMVHRDVKPSNLFLAGGPERERRDEPSIVKVLDLGLALLHDNINPEGDLTSDGQVMGTYDFIAPEQAMESHTVDARADIYSLGCTFYYLLTGRTPFQGKSEAKKLLAHQLEEPAPIERNDVPPEVLAALKKMMAKDPAKRYATMAEVAAALPSPPGRGAGGEGVRPSPSESKRNGRRPLLIAASVLLGLAAVVALVIGIIRITTPEGDYVIHTDDPTFAFSVSKGTVILEDKLKKRAYEVRVVKNKGNGVWELEVLDPANDLAFKAREFTIKRGEKVALKMWFERKDVEPDRRAAEWVVSIGGSVQVNKDEEKNIKAVGDLPAGGFELTAIHLFGNSKATDAGLAHFKACKKLEAIQLGATEVTDAGLAHFKDCKSLKNVSLHAVAVSNKGLAIFKECRDLSNLTLTVTEINDLGLANISAHANLKYLAIKGSKISREGFEKLKAALPKCRIESDYGTYDPAAAPLTAMTDREVAEWVLSKGGTVASHQHGPLTKLPLPTGQLDIDQINLSHKKEITDDDLRRLAGLKKIKFLRLFQCNQITDIGVSYLAPLKSLQHLGLVDTSATPKCLETILTLPDINNLACPNGMTDADLARLKGLKNLRGILAGHGKISDAGLLNLKQFPDLEIVSLEHFQGITDRGAATLAEFDSLYSVDLSGTSVTEKGWRALAKLPKLAAVIATEPYSEELLGVLASVPTLTEISNWRNGRHLELFKHHSSLARLSLTDPKDGDDRIPIVVTLKKLADLNIKGSKISREGFETLKAALPKCRIESDYGIYEPGTNPSPKQNTPPQSYTSPEHSDAVTHLALSRDGTKALTYTSDKLLWFWELDAQHGKFKFGWKRKVDLLLSMALTPDGSQALFAAGASSNLSQVDTQTQEITIRKRGQSFEGRVVLFSADGRRYLFGENTGLSGAFSICTWPGGEFLRKFEGHTKPVRQLCISSDGERILSAGEDQTVRLWDATNGDELKKLFGIAFDKKLVVALSPDGKQALISQGNDVRLLDLKTENVLQELKGHKAEVTALAFGPDGSWAVSASRDKTLRVWDLATGEPLAKLEGHADDVTCLAVPVAGRHVVSGSRDKTLRIWSLGPRSEKPPVPAAKAGELRRYLGHADGIRFVRVSPDGKSFLAGANGELWLWDIDKTTERIRFPMVQGNVQDAQFSADGERIVGPAQVGTVVVWENSPGNKANELARFKIQNWVESCFALPGKSRIFYANRLGGRVYDLDKKAELPLRFLGEHAVLSRDGKKILSSDGKILYLWDAETGKELSNVELPRAPYRVALAPNGRDVMAAGHKIIYRWDIVAKKEGKHLEATDSVLALAFSPNGKRALTGGYDKKLRLWDLATNTEVHCFHDHAGPVTSVAFLPDGRQAISGSNDKTIRLWQLPDEPKPKAEVGEIRSYLGHAGIVSSVAFAPDGKSFLSGGDAEFFQWDIDRGKEKRQFTDKEKPLRTARFRDHIHRIAITNDGKQAITGGDDQIVRFWDLDKGQILKRFEPAKSFPPAPHHVELSADNKYLLIGPAPTLIKLHAFPSLEESNDRFNGTQAHFSRDGNKVLVLQPGLLEHYDLNPPRRRFINVRDMNHCALSPDGRLAVCGGFDSLVYVWDMVEKKQIHKMTGHKGTIQSLAISPDGKRALSGGGDNMVRLWDLVQGKQIIAFEGHAAPVVSVAFSPDGTRALSAGGSDKAIRLWQLPE